MKFLPNPGKLGAGSTVVKVFIVLFAVGVCSVKRIYISWHRNQGVGGPYETLFYAKNDLGEVGAEAKVRIQDQEFRSGLESLKDIVQQAFDDGKRLRPYGSRWSFNDIPYTDEYMIDTYGLNYAKIGIEENSYVRKKYRGDKQELLAFVQCGCMIKYVYKALFAAGLTLTTSPTTDGQTMAGAISTGSHNAAISFGAMQDYVKGIHLVLPGRTVFIQRWSDQVVTGAYLEAIGADQLINDDALFEAAVVSSGTFGVVHGYLIETEKLFRIKTQLRIFPFDKVADYLYSLDFEALGFNVDGFDDLPWHFEFSLNPYGPNTIFGCAARMFVKEPLTEDEINQLTSSAYEPQAYGKDLTNLVAEAYGTGIIGRMYGWVSLLGNGTIERTIKRAVYFVAAASIQLALGSYAGFLPTVAYPIELYTDPFSDTPTAPVPVTTGDMEPCVPLSDLEKFINLALDILQENPAPLSLGARFVKKSRATLAPSKFDDINDDVNVYIDHASIESKETSVAYKLIMDALEERRDDISFTYHWGKKNPENDKWVPASFGDAFEEWKAQRNSLLTEELRQLFSSDFTDTLGLTGYQ